MVAKIVVAVEKKYGMCLSPFLYKYNTSLEIVTRKSIFLDSVNRDLTNPQKRFHKKLNGILEGISQIKTEEGISNFKF